MACDFEFRRLASHNKFIDDLEKQGYELDLVGGHFIIYGVPYLDSIGNRVYGDLASPVDLREDYLIDTPKTHQMWFTGETPHDVNGTPLPLRPRKDQREITPSFKCLLSFSLKIEKRAYLSFQEKMETYLNVLTAPVKEKFGESPQERHLVKRASEVSSPLRFPDTLSARDDVNELTHKLLGVKVGIVGVGGTGAYILDFLSKTHLQLIRIFDDDIIHVHTLFRMPGVLSTPELGRKKVEVLCNIYSGFTGAIDPVPERIQPSNIDRLFDLDFVFVSIDDGPSREFIAKALAEKKIPFIDVGMGLYKSSLGLNGMIRTTGCNPNDNLDLIGTPYLPGGNPADHEYRRQPQIGELNAFNAALAVIKFKQHLGILERDLTSTAFVFEIGSLVIDHSGVST